MPSVASGTATELIFTSAPRGIRAGRSGFCTVAMTSGAFEPLVDRLESLSGYRHLFPVGSPDWDRNPHAYAHWRLSVGGQGYGVLSHVCSTVDHQSRQSKFAHHLAMAPAEMPPGGPAWAMLQPGVMEDRWSGEPRLLPRRRTLPGGENPPRRCEAWERLAGDAGWAGALAEAFLLDGSKVSYIIYEPGTDVLPLIDEAVALLPESRRWQVAFSTYYTESPMGLPCAWRCCAAGSPAAAAARANATSGIVIDLRAPAPLERSGKYVAFARTGKGDIRTGVTDSGSRHPRSAPRTESPDRGPAAEAPLEIDEGPAAERSPSGRAAPKAAAHPPAAPGTSPAVIAAAILLALIVGGAGWVALRSGAQQGATSPGAENADLRWEVDGLKRELADARRDLAGARKDLVDAGKRVGELERERDDWKHKTEDALADVKRLGEEVASAQERAFTPGARAPGEPPPRTGPGSRTGTDPARSPTSGGTTRPGPAPGEPPAATGGSSAERRDLACETLSEGVLAVELPVPRAGEDDRPATTYRLLRREGARRVLLDLPSDRTPEEERFKVRESAAGFALLYDTAAGGLLKSIELASAAAEGGEVAWSWTAGESWSSVPAQSLAALLRVSTVRVQGDGDGDLARLQLARPVRVDTRVEREVTPVPGAGARSAPRLELVEVPAGWARDAEEAPPGSEGKIRLRSEHGARLEIDLRVEKDEGRILLSWAAERAKAAKDHKVGVDAREAARKSAADATKALKTLEAERARLAELRSALPMLKNEGKSTDEIDWKSGKFKDRFEKYLRCLSGIRDLHPSKDKGEVPPEPDKQSEHQFVGRVQERLERTGTEARDALAEAERFEGEAKGRLADLDRMGAFELRVTASRSGVLLAVVRVLGKAAPDRR